MNHLYLIPENFTSNFLGWILVCRYAILILIVWLNFNLLHSSQLITYPTQSCLVLCSLCSIYLCDSLFHLLPHDLHKLFCCVLSINDLIYLVLMALFHGSREKDSLSLLWFLFLCHVQVISCAISSVCRLNYPYSYFSSISVGVVEYTDCISAEG